MAKSMSHLDWTDVAMMTGALEALHTCRVEWTVTARGQGHNGGLHVTMDGVFSVLPGSDLPKRVGVTGDWPSGYARSFEGLVYNLLWQLDYAIGRAYEQMELPGA